MNKGEEANLVKIVTANLIKKFAQDPKVLRMAKKILKKSTHIPTDLLNQVKGAYQELREKDPLAVANEKYSQSSNESLDIEKMKKEL